MIPLIVRFVMLISFHPFKFHMFHIRMRLYRRSYTYKSEGQGTSAKKFHIQGGKNVTDHFGKKFQLRMYDDGEDGLIIEVSRISDVETAIAIVNYLERLRE